MEHSDHTWPLPPVTMARSLLRYLIGIEPADFLAQGSWPARGMAVLAPWLIQQQLGPLAYARCRLEHPALAACLQADTYSALAENSLHFDNLEQIISAFQKNDVPVVLLKGAALAETAYDHQALRTMSDVDIWVHEQDMARAFRLMQDLEFQAERTPHRPPPLQRLANGEIRFYRNKWRRLVELHWAPCAGWWLQRTAAVDNAAMWARKEPVPGLGSHVYQLAAEDTVIQLAVHQSVNHQFGLAAVRSLVDIALTAQRRQVDWHEVASRAQSWRVATAVWTVLVLLEAVIGVPGVEAALAQLRPSCLRQTLLHQLVSPESVLASKDLRSGRARYLLLLLMVDRPRDVFRLIFRTFWPEREWLAARYGTNATRVRHLWGVLRRGQV